MVAKKGGKGGNRRYQRDAGGRFSSVSGGPTAPGGKTLGGYRGIVARARLRRAERTLSAARRDGTYGPKQLARRERAVASHRREVARIERRGQQRVRDDRVKRVSNPHFSGGPKRVGLDRKARRERSAPYKLTPQQKRESRAQRVVYGKARLAELKSQRPGDALRQSKETKERLRMKMTTKESVERSAADLDARHARRVARAERAVRVRERQLARFEAYQALGRWQAAG